MIKLISCLLGISLLTSCSVLDKPTENNIPNSYGFHIENMPSDGIFSYEINTTQPLAMVGLEGTFIRENDCLFFKNSDDNRKLTPVFPVQFTKFNKEGDIISIGNEPIRVGEKFSIGGFIVKNERSQFTTKGHSHCLTDSIAVLGIGVSKSD